MKSILEELYYGNLHPGGRCFKPGSEYDRAANSFAEASDKFRSMLDESQKKAYEDVQASQYKVERMELTDKFIYGFRMGLLMAMEAYNTSDEFIFGGI